MKSNVMQQIVEMIETEVHSRPSPIEFEMAYQVRVAMDRIRFAIKHADQFSQPSDQMREASLQLLEALDRLEYLDRRFQVRSQIRTGAQSPDLKRPTPNLMNGQERRSSHERPNGS